MEYNTTRKPLVIPEYGRYIQQMVDHCVEIDDREKRNMTAKKIIRVMGQYNPHLKDVEDFQHKLWDQLFIMSDFQLDVDSPYPVTAREDLMKKPEVLPYPATNKSHRYYGINLKKVIDKIVDYKDEDTKTKAAILIAKHMKRCYVTWNKLHVEDEVIFQHLYELSDQAIDIRQQDLVLGKPNKNNYKKKSGHNHKNKHKYNKKRN